MEKLIAGVGIIVVFAAPWAGLMWGIWSLWCWVLPQVYEGGPHNLIAPGFWLFAACWTLAGLVGRSIFGRGKAAE